MTINEHCHEQILYIAKENQTDPAFPERKLGVLNQTTRREIDLTVGVVNLLYICTKQSIPLLNMGQNLPVYLP